MALTLAMGVLTACNIDLSHKHYVNNYGVCNQCQQDVSVLLTKGLDGRYVSTDISANAYYDTIIRFVGNNENGICVRIETNGGVTVGNVKLYSQTSAYMSQSTGTIPLVWQGVMENGKTYYVRIPTTGSGTIKVVIEENQ